MKSREVFIEEIKKVKDKPEKVIEMINNYLDEISKISVFSLRNLYGIKTQTDYLEEIIDKIEELYSSL